MLKAVSDWWLIIAYPFNDTTGYRYIFYLFGIMVEEELMFTRKEKNMLYDPYFEVIRETEQFIEVRSANTGHCWSVFKNIYNAPRKIT